MSKVDVHQILEENAAYRVWENFTSFRDTEKKAIYFLGRDTSLKAETGNLGTHPSQMLEKDRKTPILYSKPLLVRAAERPCLGWWKKAFQKPHQNMCKWFLGEGCAQTWQHRTEGKEEKEKRDTKKGWEKCGCAMSGQSVLITAPQLLPLPQNCQQVQSIFYLLFLWMCAWRQCFGWQMWMRWHKSGAGRTSFMPKWQNALAQTHKALYTGIFITNLNIKMTLKRKMVALPTHNDIMPYQYTHTHSHIPVSRRSTAMQVTHSNRGHGQVGSRKADRSSSPHAVKLGGGQELLHSKSWTTEPMRSVTPERLRTP